MIDLTKQQIVRRGSQIPIAKWEVWFQTPFGITPDIKEAVEACVEKEADPELYVVPIPVAVGSEGTQETFFVRR